MWVHDTLEVDSVILHLRLPSAVRNELGYGAPATVWLNITTMSASQPDVPTTSEPTGLHVELVWADKMAAMLPESSWLEFRPLLPSESTWRLFVDKLGSIIDTADVVNKGGAALHGVDPNGGITWKEDPGSDSRISLRSLDAGLVAPGDNLNTWNFALFDFPSAKVDPRAGAAFNLHSNLYHTNYILYYPFLRNDSHSRFRFQFEI